MEDNFQLNFSWLQEDLPSLKIVRGVNDSKLHQTNRGVSVPDLGELLPVAQLLQNSIPFNRTHSIFYLTSQHIVSITGQQAHALYPNISSGMADVVENQIFSRSVEAAATETIPVTSSNLIVAAQDVPLALPKLHGFLKDMEPRGDNLCSIASVIDTIPHSGSMAGKGLPTLNSSNDGFASSNSANCSELVAEINKPLVIELLCKTQEVTPSNSVQNRPSLYDQNNKWSTEQDQDYLNTNPSGSLGFVSEVKESESFSGAGSFGHIPDIVYSQSVANHTSTQANFHFPMEYPDEGPTTGYGIITSKAPASILDLTLAKDSSDDHYSNYWNQSDRIVMSPGKKLCVDHASKDDIYQHNDSIKVDIMPCSSQDGAATWVDSLRTDDSGCHDDGSAQSTSAEEPQDYIVTLGTILQEKVSSEVNVYINSVKDIIRNNLSTQQKPAENSQEMTNVTELENEVYHHRILQKLHHHASKITRLILKRTLQSLLPIGNFPPRPCSSNRTTASRFSLHGKSPPSYCNATTANFSPPSSRVTPSEGHPLSVSSSSPTLCGFSWTECKSALSKENTPVPSYSSTPSVFSAVKSVLPLSHSSSKSITKTNLSGRKESSSTSVTEPFSSSSLGPPYGSPGN